MHPMHTGSSGQLEVICGPMFSGKTEELIRRVRRAVFAKQKVALFKPKIDTRYDENHIVSHNSQSMMAIPIVMASEIPQRIEPDTTLIAIDEVQFFEPSVIQLCERLAHEGRRVIVAGLDLDFRGEPFSPVPELMARAEYVTKILAICMVCGQPASRTQRLSQKSELVLVGAKDMYEARCRACHSIECMPKASTLPFLETA